MQILMSPWKGGTPRRLCRALELRLRSPEEVEQILEKRSPRAELILNWGCSRVLSRGPKMFNYPSMVALASNKLACFKALAKASVDTLEWTEDLALAAGQWHPKHSVIAHFDLHAHSAKGLVLYKKGEGDMTQRKDLKLFTKYFQKEVESRVLCVLSGDSMKYHTFYMEKKRQQDPAKLAEKEIEGSPSTYIRTWDNGWIFARDVLPDISAISLAVKAMSTLTLAYGAVDIMKDRRGNYKVGEVNTAPGLEGKALEFFVQKLRKLIVGAE